VGQTQAGAANRGNKSHVSITQELLSVNHLSANMSLLLGSLLSPEELHV